MSENIILNSKTENIKLFKKIYLLLIILCVVLQIVISENFIDYKVLGLLTLMNLIALFYCIDENNFFYFPISLSAIFFSIFFNSAGALFLKSLELQKISTGLYAPYETYKILFIANLAIIFTHWLYKKKIFKKENTFLFNLNNKLGLFDTNLNFIYVLGIIAILSKFFINPFTYGLELRLDQLKDYPVWIDFLRGFGIFYYLPFLLILSVPLFKKEFKVNKKMMFILILSVIYLSVGTNRREIFLFALLSFILMVIIVFLLNKIKFRKKNFFIIFILMIFTSFSYEKIEIFSKIYVIERVHAGGKTLFQNVSSFYDIIKRINSKTIDINIYEDIYANLAERSHFYDTYYSSHIFERINPIKYSDNVMFYSQKLSQKDIDELKKIAFYRVIAIIPQPIINVFNKNFQKSDYIYETIATRIYEKIDSSYAGHNDVGSGLVEFKIFFGKLFFLPLMFVSFISFIIFDSFYDRKKEIFSPIILISFLYAGGASVLSYFSSASADVMFNALLRELPQAMFLFIISNYIYNFFSKH